MYVHIVTVIVKYESTYAVNTVYKHVYVSKLHITTCIMHIK